MLLITAMSYPFAIDGTLVPAIDRNTDIAKQILLMDNEAVGLTMLVVGAAKRIAGRARPFTLGCAKSVLNSHECGSRDDQASFFSGHAALSATAAGLTCAHHANLPLYGGGAGDVVACATSSALSLVIGTLRIAAADRPLGDGRPHTGWGVGFGIDLRPPDGAPLHRARSYGSAAAVSSAMARVRGECAARVFLAWRKSLTPIPPFPIRGEGGVRERLSPSPRMGRGV